MFLKGRDTCMGCPVHCKQVFENEDKDPYRKLDPDYCGAEYEAMGAAGSACDVHDNLAVLKANEFANAYGLDCISAGMSIAFVMECFENGLLSSADTGGLEYPWGDGDVVARSLEMIGKREGSGDIMAEGVERMSKRFGPATEAYNLTVKGQELPMHEPRHKHGLGVGYAVSPRGADHMINIHDPSYASDGRFLRRVNTAVDTPIAPLPKNVLNEDKMQIFYHEVNWMHFQDCAGNCHFYCCDYSHLAEALSGVSGVEYGIHDVLAVGARAQTLARLFNLREGLTVAEDRLPKRITTAFESEPLAGSEITDEALTWARGRFFELMQWDPETGEPTEACLCDLQLDTLL